MSDHFVHAYNECDGNSGQSSQSYHSVWMSHWTRRSYKEIIPNHKCSSSSFMNKESCHASNEYMLTSGKEIASNVCSPSRGLGEIKSGSLKIKNESSKTTSMASGMEKMKFQSSPTDGSCKKGENISNRKDSQAASDIEALRARQSDHNLDFDSTALSLRCYMPPLLSVAPDADKIPSKECHFEAEGMLQNTKEHVETCSFFGDSSFAIPRSLSKDLNKSSTDIVQRGLGNRNEGRSQLGWSALAPEEQSPQIEPSFVDSENLDYSQRLSTFIVCENQRENHSKAGRFLTSRQQQNKAPSFETDPCKINNHLTASGREQFPETKNATGIRIFWNQSNHQGITRSENLYNVCSSSHKFPHSLQDLESMRICTTLDSVVPLRGVQPRFSQTTHSLLITKRTDLSSCKIKASFENLRESARSNGDTLLQLCNMPPSFGSGSQGVKIESFGSSTDSEGKEIVGDPLGRFGDAEVVKAFDNSVEGKGKDVVDDPDQKNESSAETATMDIDDLKEQNHHLSVNSSPASEVLKLSLVTPRDTLGSTNKCKQLECKLPVINLELPALPAANNGDAGSSRTESLDMETFFAHVEPPLSYSKSDRCLGGSATPELSSRWIKRLKSSASESYAFGTKYSDTGEWPCHEKKSPGKNLKGLSASSDPTVNELHGKELMVLDKTTASVRCSESSSMETREEGRHSLTSQSWIRRWCHNQSATPQKKPETTVVCEPQSSKLAFEDLQEKQFPSIAAMALMGRAMRGFQPCDLEKKGSVIVWNTRGL